MDPEIGTNPNLAKDLISEFGFSSGQFILNYPDSWKSQLKTALKSRGVFNGGYEARVIREVLLKCAECLCPCEQRQFDSSKSWIENAEENLEPSESVISTANKPGWIDPVDFLEGYGVKIPRVERISETVEDYLRAIEHLIVLSKEIYVADRFYSTRYQRQKNGPFFRAKDAYEFALNLGLLARSSGRKGQLIRFFIEKNTKLDAYDSAKRVDALDSDFDDINEQLNTDKIKIDYLLVPEMKHWRYVFSMKGAVKFDAGIQFKKSEKDPKNELTWLPASSISDLLEEYNEYFPAKVSDL
jgi:hypothetical protein